VLIFVPNAFPPDWNEVAKLKRNRTRLDLGVLCQFKGILDVHAQLTDRVQNVGNAVTSRPTAVS
jgi:hypothetical protein